MGSLYHCAVASAHFYSHVTDVPENGLSAQLVGQVAHAAASRIAGLQGGSFELSKVLGMLRLREGRGLHFKGGRPRRGGFTGMHAD